MISFCGCSREFLRLCRKDYLHSIRLPQRFVHISRNMFSKYWEILYSRMGNTFWNIGWWEVVGIGNSIKIFNIFWNNFLTNTLVLFFSVFLFIFCMTYLYSVPFSTTIVIPFEVKCAGRGLILSNTVETNTHVPYKLQKA